MWGQTINTFGSTTQQFGLMDARSVAADRQRFRRDVIPMLERANHFYCPAGRWPFRGWVLLPRADYDLIDRYSTTLELHIGDTNDPDNVGALGSLAIVQARCVTQGLAADDNALYLIELTDARGILQNDLFQFPLTAQYNIRAPAYPQTFHPASMNSGTTWTWSTMLQNIWTTMTAFLGTWPGLPYAPAGTPEGFWFPGVPAWDALCDVLDQLGMQVACDLTDDAAPYTIVSTGADDPSFVALQGKYGGRLEDDAEWVDVGAARVPAIVKVLFKRRNEVYGTEETTPYRNDAMAQQWDMAAYYTVTGSAPAFFAGAVGTHFIWSDFTVRYDENSLPLAADVVTAALIAAERVTQYFDRIYSRTSGSMSQVYAGALPFSNGSQTDGISWCMSGRYGWRTHVVRGAQPPWPEVYG